MRTLLDETREAKYAHVERERRWLVRPGAAPERAALRCLLIEDRYIEATRFRLRRMTDIATGECALKLGKKYEADDPLARPMVTAYLSEAEYAVFAALPALPLIKRRYTVAEDGLHFNVDLFGGALTGLVLTEIEQDDDVALRALSAPSWAGREVSHDPHYQGGALARHGIPEEISWPSS
jgi:CYTH domain-containing protein